MWPVAYAHGARATFRPSVVFDQVVPVVYGRLTYADAFDTARSMIDFVQQTFVTLFDGSPEKALRAVLIIMGLYVLTAAPLVAWVAYGLFQTDPKESVAVNAEFTHIFDMTTPLAWSTGKTAASDSFSC